MARLVFSIFAGFALFAILALGVWRANGFNGRAESHSSSTLAQASTLLPMPLVVPAAPHPPSPCQQFVDLMPVPPDLNRDMGQALFLAVARGDKETALVWQTDPPLRDQLWD